ncbi:MAG TPA: helix-turn-helix domain-containing protein [Ramlibacter sp.]|jgi:DNA-binding CsgD family transcriptional regulator|nr:helix-turn-helix domain-containing protein [Ramlibacter sp.]
MTSRARVAAEDDYSEMAHWHSLLWEFRAKAVLVLGPAVFAANDHRELVAAYPGEYRLEAAALARSDAYGPPWRLRAAPLAAWRNLVGAHGADERWMLAWQSRGARALVRVDFPTALGHGYECFTMCGRALAGEHEAMRIAYSVMKLWPAVKAQVVPGRHDVTARELEVLRALADGLTVKDAADCIGIAERTVAFHLGNLQIKLHAGNRASVVQRACCLGLL